MASSAKHFSIFLLLITLLSSLHITHARDITSFNKALSTTNNVVPNNKQELLTNNQPENEPNFLPENENSYGLYGQNPARLTPSTATATNGMPTTTIESKQPLHKYLPKNYNPVAYVTEPEDTMSTSGRTPFPEEKSFSTSSINPYRNNYYSGAENYYNNQQEDEPSEYRSFNSQPQGMRDTRFRGSSSTTLNSRPNNNYNNFDQPQGMSDTRFLENGKYFYDLNTERYSSNHPYESLKRVRPRNEYYNNRNYYGNPENVYDQFDGGVNSRGGYRNQDEEFQVEENNLP